MRIPPIAVLFLLAASSTQLGSIVLAAAPSSAYEDSADGFVPERSFGNAPNSYYPTWQQAPENQSIPHAGGRTGPDGSVPDRSGWVTGNATMQYPEDQGTATAQLMNPYLLHDAKDANGNPTPGHRVDDILSPFVPQYAVFYGEDGRSTTRVDANLGLYLQRDLDLEASQIKAGPLFIHFTQIDVIGLYSDLSGSYAAQEPGSDRFIGAVGLKFNIDLRLSPRTFLDVQGEVYYVLPVNRFGFYAQDSTQTYAHFEHSVEVDRWDLTFFDYLDVITPLSYLLRYGTDDSAFDRSGLYTVGFVNMPGFNHNFDSDLLYFRNSVGARASTFLQSDLRFTAGYEHYDVWYTGAFKHLPNLDHFDTGLFYEPKDLWFLPWTTYDAYISDGYREALSQWYVGATLPFSRAVQAYARVGWQWDQGNYGHGFNDGTLVWDVGVNHQIDQEWKQSLVAGNSYRISPILDQERGLYASYALSFTSQCCPLIAGVNATWLHQTPLDGNLGGDYSSVFSGYVGYTLNDRTSVRGTIMYAPSDFPLQTGDGSSAIWLYRAELDRRLTPTLDLQFIYQLTNYHTSLPGSSYVDNLFMVTLSKRL